MTNQTAFEALIGLVAGAIGLGDAPLPVSPDPAAMLALARRHRVTILVERQWRHLAASGQAPPVPHLISAAARQEQVRALANAAALARLARALDGAGVTWMALKGPALSQQIYGDPACRTTRDIDILVEPKDMLAAVAVAKDLGWRIADDWQRLAQLSGKYDLELAPGKPAMPPLEIHVRLGHTEDGVGSADIWAGVGRVVVAGYPVPILTGLDQLAYVAGHGGKHFWFRLNWLADLAVLLTGIEDGEPVIDRARELGAERSVRAGAALAARMFGLVPPAFPVPPAAMRRPVARLAQWGELRIRLDAQHPSVVDRPWSFLWTIREWQAEDAGMAGLLPLFKRLWRPREADARRVGLDAPLAVHVAARVPLLLYRVLGDLTAAARKPFR